MASGLLLTGVGASGTALAGRPLRFGMTPAFLNNQHTLLGDWQTYLEKTTGGQFEFVQRDSYRETMDLLMQGKLDFAWLCDYPFVYLKDLVRLLAVPLNQGRPTYRSYLITQATDPARKSMADFKGTVFAYADPYSNTGYLAPRYRIRELGDNPATFFRKTFFTWSHRKVVEAVAKGYADGGAVDSFIRDSLARVKPELVARTRIVERSQEFGFPPIVAHRGVPQATYALLQRTLLGMSSDIKDLSIPDQLKRMRAYCEAHDFRILDEYVDEGRTATDDNRPAFQAMLHRVTDQSERVHAIVVHSFSRAHRNVTDLALYLRKLRAVGTRLVSVTQDVDESPIGKFVTLFYGLVDEMNSAENSKHVKRALEENARRGYFNGSKPPYGYKAVETKVVGRTGYRKILAINEEEAGIVREIYDLYEGLAPSGQMGMKKIVEHLNAKCLRRGQLWSVQKVQRILSDPVYTGAYNFGARTWSPTTNDEEE